MISWNAAVGACPTIAVTATTSFDADANIEGAGDDVVAAARDGDPSAQAALFDAHKQRVSQQILRMTGDATAVDDLVQEVFIAAFGNLDRFRGEAQLRTWLYRITFNKARNWVDSQRRRVAREARASTPSVDLTASAPDRRLEAHDRLLRFYDALNTLPTSFRDAFVARAIEQQSLEEASEHLSVPISTVSYRARRAEFLLCKALGLPVGRTTAVR
jgi:RNA polymerase sigma-70 factor (ECF subfamily)